MELDALDPTTVDSEVARWVMEIKLYDKEAEKWVKKAKKIVRRYKDERNGNNTDNTKARYNILYSNVQTLLPAYFSRSPKPDIQRRFKDDDDLGRVTADVWERCTGYFVDTDKFKESVKQAVFDRLVPGRGITWVRYVPHMKDIQVAGNDDVKEEGSQVTDDVEGLQEVEYEEVISDYVYWEDFGHTVARCDAEIRAKWRKVYLANTELKERFGEKKAKLIPLDYSPRNLDDEKITEDMKKATIYEIWDKPSKKAIWIHKDVPEVLDEVDDPLGLDDFFPCPRALTPTLTNDTTIPVPDYLQYQDQALELDNLTGRIASITKALKVAGVYDASAEGVNRLLSEGVENQLIPVEQWAVFGEKGGLKGVMDLLPMQDIMNTLLGLYEARDKVKSDLYEITGLADIIRGGSDPNETATAQKIKGNFATLRLDDGQQEVQRFARDLVRIIAQIIANHFSLETIKAISGIKLMTTQEKQQFQMQRQQVEGQAQQAAMLAQQSGQQPPPLPPIPDDMQELLDNPTWEEVYNLLKDNAARCFKIDIETDSTIKEDQEADKQARIEFLTAVGGFMQQAIPIAQQSPEIAPLIMEMLMFGIRGFKVGKSMESVFELYQRKLQKKSENPPEQPANPEMMKIQADKEAAQEKHQLETQKHADQMQLEKQRTESDADLTKYKIDQETAADMKKHSMKVEADKEGQKMMAKAAEKPTSMIQIDSEGAMDQLGESLGQIATEMAEIAKQTNEVSMQTNQSVTEAVQALTMAVQGIMSAVAAPKTLKAPDGKTYTATIG